VYIIGVSMDEIGVEDIVVLFAIQYP